MAWRQGGRRSAASPEHQEYSPRYEQRRVRTSLRCQTACRLSTQPIPSARQRRAARRLAAVPFHGCHRGLSNFTSDTDGDIGARLILGVRHECASGDESVRQRSSVDDSTGVIVSRKDGRVDQPTQTSTSWSRRRCSPLSVRSRGGLTCVARRCRYRARGTIAGGNRHDPDSVHDKDSHWRWRPVPPHERLRLQGAPSGASALWVAWCVVLVRSPPSSALDCWRARFASLIGTWELARRLPNEADAALDDRPL